MILTSTTKGHTKICGNVFITKDNLDNDILFHAGVAEHGQRRRLQEPILQGFVGSNPTPCTEQEPTAFREFLLSKTNLTRETIDRRVKAIK